MKNIIKNTNKKGFTIVELVIVIAVIAILAGVLIPTFSSIITKANKSAALQEAQAVYKEVYALDISDGSLDGKINKLDATVSNFNFKTAAGIENGEKVKEYKVDATNGKVTSFKYTTDKYTVTYDGIDWTAGNPSGDDTTGDDTTGDDATGDDTQG